MTLSTPEGKDSPIVYVVDDDVSVRAALEDLLASVGLQVLSFGSTQEFIAHDRADAPASLAELVRVAEKLGM